MHFIDWFLIAIPLVIVFGVGIYTQRYVKSVADFLSGGRLAGRYLLAVSRGEMFAGAVVFVAAFEQMSRSGFTLTWWGFIGTPVALIVTVGGFVIYRYRETRAQTLAQFFEIRYSKSFRLFTGVLGFLAGMLNFGIIPSVGARFFVYFLGLPASVPLLSHSVPTYILLMGGFLAITVAIALAGGLITVMITDCLEGIISQILYLVIIASLIAIFPWHEISQVLGDRPAGQSLLNPFDSLGLKDFNIWYLLMSTFLGVYGTMAWQNQSSYNAASLTAHESRMGFILGKWREGGKLAVVTLLAVCAVAFLHHPRHAVQAAEVRQEIQRIPQRQIQEQMEVPVALSHLLPAGVKGALCVILLMGIFGGDSTHLHSWGGLLIQDVIVPLRKKPLGPKQHIRLLRFSIAGVAVFALIFGSLFKQTEYIQMWWSVTQAIFVGGAGAAIIGGLYWKKGTTAGAWAGLITGSTLSVAGILARQIYGDAFRFNGQEISFYSTLIAIAAYVFASLLTHKEDFDLDRMLHRGEYAALKPLVGDKPEPTPGRGRIAWLARIFGFDEHFTRGDKWIAGVQVGWGMFWFFVYLGGTIWNLISPWPEPVWSAFWHIVGIGVPIVFAAVTAVWFTWGGIRDMRDLFRRLSTQKVNHMDDGTVVGHLNMDETTLKTPPPGKFPDGNNANSVI